MHKRKFKKIRKWSAFYYPHPTSCYPLPGDTISLEDLPKFTRISPKTAPQEQMQEMKDFCEMFGRAVRQNSNRHTTTMENAGTPPESCYRNEFIDEKVNFISTEAENQTEYYIETECYFAEEKEELLEYDSDESRGSSKNEDNGDE